MNIWTIVIGFVLAVIIIMAIAIKPKGGEQEDKQAPVRSVDDEPRHNCPIDGAVMDKQLILDGQVVIESGAIVDHLIRRHGGGRLQPDPASREYDQSGHSER